jgi:hypothetical protein
MITLLEDQPVTPRVLADFVDRTGKLMAVLNQLETVRRRRSNVIEALEAQALELRRDVVALAQRHAPLHDILSRAGIIIPSSPTV